MKSKIKFLLRKSLFYIFRIFRIKKNKIVITNFYGKGYGDSSKYICNYLLNKFEDEVEIVWLVNDVKANNNLPSAIRPVKYKSLRAIYELSTAKIWIDNARKPQWFVKRKKQYYIQLWHSSLRLKKIEKDAESHLPIEYINNAKNDSKMINLMISGCDFSYNTYKNSFWYDGEILKCGTPRCDILFDKKKTIELKEKICKQYNIDSNNKLLLYAPTFRKDSLSSNENIDFESVLKSLKEKYNSEFTCLLRYHPNSKIDYNDTDNVKNVTKYSDMQELISICDVMITDYSGCCFDMAICKKPCILYVKDLEEYLSKERELYFDFRSLPFPIAESDEELLNIISNFDYDNYLEKLNEFDSIVNFYEDGNASKRVCERIIEVIHNE